MRQHRIQVGSKANIARQEGPQTALDVVKLAAQHICYACGGPNHQEGPQNYIYCNIGCQGGAFFLMVDACRYHALKTDILAIDACTSQWSPTHYICTVREEKSLHEVREVSRLS